MWTLFPLSRSGKLNSQSLLDFPILLAVYISYGSVYPQIISVLTAILLLMILNQNYRKKENWIGIIPLSVSQYVTFSYPSAIVKGSCLYFSYCCWVWGMPGLFVRHYYFTSILFSRTLCSSFIIFTHNADSDKPTAARQTQGRI